MWRGRSFNAVPSFWRTSISFFFHEEVGPAGFCAGPASDFPLGGGGRERLCGVSIVSNGKKCGSESGQFMGSI